jgi:hypothetical protein
MSEADEHRPEPQRVKLNAAQIVLKLPKLIRLGIGLQKHYRDQLFVEGDPRDFVVLNDHSRAIRDRARELSAEDREDDEAVRELSTMGRRHERDLKVAELAARERGAHLQSREANLAQRLLQAAVSGSHVRPVDPEELELIERCEAFGQLSNEEAFSALSQIEPELRTLETDAKEGRLGRRHTLELMRAARLPHDQLDEASREELRGYARESLQASEALKRRLDPLVGPDAQRGNLLLKTQLAYDTAEARLGQLLESDDS